MNAGTSRGRNARVLKGLSLLYLGLVVAALLLVHGDSYRPPVSYVPLYLIVSVIFTEAVALLLLPTRQFGEGFCAVCYVLYAVFLAAAAFFTGGVSSELYVLFFPLILAPACTVARVGSSRKVLLGELLLQCFRTPGGVETLTDRHWLLQLALFLMGFAFARSLELAAGRRGGEGSPRTRTVRSPLGGSRRLETLRGSVGVILVIRAPGR